MLICLRLFFSKKIGQLVLRWCFSNLPAHKTYLVCLFKSVDSQVLSLEVPIPEV